MTILYVSVAGSVQLVKDIVTPQVFWIKLLIANFPHPPPAPPEAPPPPDTNTATVVAIVIVSVLGETWAVWYAVQAWRRRGGAEKDDRNNFK